MRLSSFENKKALKFVITLGNDPTNPRTFGNSNNNQIIIQGLRATINIDKAGGMMMGTLRARVYGVSQADMNSITTLQYQPNYMIKNIIQVYAIDGIMDTLVFAGDIVNAWGDYLNMPDVFLQIQAMSAFFSGLQSVPPLSVKGGISVPTAMSQIAQKMGLTFENNNVTTTLSNIYLPNTLKEQALTLARAANCWLYIDDTTLAITNKYSARQGGIPNISAQSGLVGYPTFDGIGVNFRTLFNPAISFGGMVQLTTDIKRAAGQWIVTSISHDLESEKPGGRWISSIRGNTNGNPNLAS